MLIGFFPPTLDCSGAILLHNSFHITGVLAEEAKRIASLYSDVLSAIILDFEHYKQLKMGSYLAVAAASETLLILFIYATSLLAVLLRPSWL